MKLPLILLAHERPTMFDDCLTSIVNNTDMDLINLVIVDNSSQDPRMKKMLKKWGKDYYIILNKENTGLHGFNIGIDHAFKDGWSDYFLISDPDILLPCSIPHDWPLVFVRMLEFFKTCPKVGVALDHFGLKEKMRTIYEIEDKLQGDGAVENHCPIIQDRFYFSPLDTTLCMFRSPKNAQGSMYYWNGKDVPMFQIRDYFLPQTHYHKSFTKQPIRISDRFLSRHLGWALDEERYREDMEFYRQSIRHGKTDKRLSSTMGIA